MATRVAAGLGLVLAAGCGGGGGGGTSFEAGDDPPPSDAAAARFLTQATFGPTFEDIELLNHIGYTQWFEWQRDLAPSLSRPALERQAASGADTWQIHRQERWWLNVVEGEDQLRQRVAFALSQLFVVSEKDGTLGGDPVGMAEYYDLLVRGAFGNYRDLLEDVTLSPAMGAYLSMLRNQKPDPAANVSPDENYAREVLQLFSIGLHLLDPSGRPVLDSGGEPIPTYTQEVVEGFAHVFTGWNYADADSWRWPDVNYRPMEPWEEYHDTGAKELLDGLLVPGGLAAAEDLDLALDAIFQHPNVGPFVCRQLIQRLVTSNPNPGYVGRVAAVFADNGAGVRGDLWAVVVAILTDPEARTGHQSAPTTFGKLREPLIRLAHLLRACDARTGDDRYTFWGLDDTFGQSPLGAPSVFNFFSPSYAPPGEVADAGLVAPEFQITTHSRVATGQNALHARIFWNYVGDGSTDDDDILIDVRDLAALAADAGALVDRLGLLFLGGAMSTEMRDVLVAHVESIDLAEDDAATRRALDALYLVVTSPEAAVQK